MLFLDATLNLDTLLIQIKAQVTPKWYQLGVALKINKEILDKFCECSDEESIVEVLDYWLRNSSSKPTWRAVAKALNEIELHELEERILKIYKTGQLTSHPVQVYYWKQSDNGDLNPNSHVVYSAFDVCSQYH